MLFMRKKVNIIFLDMDGVMNSEESNFFNFHFNNEKYASYLLKKSPFENNIDLQDIQWTSPICCSNLTKILQECPNTKIVISSTWRKRDYFTKSYANQLFHTLGITKAHPCTHCDGDGGIYSSNGKGGIVRSHGCTVCNGLKNNPNTIDKDLIIDFTPVLQGKPRGDEIALWLKENKDKYDVNQFVILDDDTDMAEFKDTPHFVQTNNEQGLSIQEVKRIIEFLNENSPQKS